MKADKDILDRNIGLLLRHAYVPALPAPEFRQRLVQTLGIEARRLARERAAQSSESITTAGTTTLARWRRVGVGLAAAAAILLLAFGAFFVWGADPVLERADLLARGDVAVQVGAEDWRAASAEELENGLPLKLAAIRIETPDTHSFALRTSAGRVDLEPASSLAASAEGEPLADALRIEQITLVAGRAAYTGPTGLLELTVGETLRLVEGIPEASSVALVGPEALDERRPVNDAQGQVEEEPDAATPFATLAGDVLTAKGEPVGDFRIGILRQRIGNEYDNPDTKDFENGTFVWEGIRPGKYRIYVSAAGYAILDLGWVDLENEYAIDVRLVAGGTIRGHVLDEVTGNPVPGALVLSEEDAPQDGLLLFPDADDYQWLPKSTRTLADGSFELVNVSPGRHTLRFNAEGYGAVWIDDVTVTEDAITDGLSVVLEAGGAVEGLVTHADGSPRVGEQIIVAIMNDNLRPRMNFAAGDTDAEGRYRVENLPAQMMLVVQVEKRFDARPVVRSVDIVAGETVVVDFPGGPPGARVSGRVLRGDGKPIAHHNIALLDKASDWSQMQKDFIASTTLSDGSFLFEGIAPGEYLLYMVEDMGRWIRLADRFEVPDWPELERLVTIADLEVGGLILDSRSSEPVADCTLVLELIEDGETIFAGNSITDEKGRFTFDLLNPGRYRVTAYPAEAGLDGLGFEKSEAFTIDEANPSADVELQLSDGAVVEVHVVDPEGAPIARASVLFVNEANEAFVLGQYPITDDRGIFRAVGVRAGEHKVLVGANGYEGPPILFRCRRNQENRVEVTLTPVAAPDHAGEER